MLLRALILVLTLGSLSVAGLAQFTRTLHNSVHLDTATTITVDIAGDEVVVEPWAGNTILVETQVKLFNASKGIFEHYVEREERYAIEHGLTGYELRISSKDPVRKPIKSKRGVSTEEVSVRVFVPSDFIGEGTGPYTRGDAGSRS